MIFISVRFVIFFITLLIILKQINEEKVRQSVLICFSIVFYACCDYRYLALLFLQIFIAYSTAVLIKRKNLSEKASKTIFIIGIILCLSVLGMLKYYNFFVESFANLFKLNTVGTLKLFLPVGISYYTFQALSYIIDVYQGKTKVEYSFKKIVLYLSFFPQITAGPIAKSHDFLPELENEHKITWKNIEAGLQIFLMGMVKKIVIADRIALAVNAVYASPNAYSWSSILCAVIGYSIQIYCDFSGYSDMAIGIAKCMGYNLTRNFNAPYIALNPSDFWSRWHISLSSWFKEYVYIPLGGNRKGRFRTYFNLFIVMLLSGLWHGANWTFVLWGIIHGIASIVHKLFCEIRKKYNLEIKNVALGKVVQVLSAVAMYCFASLSLVIFRAEDISSAFRIYFRLFTFSQGVNYIYVYTVIFAVVLMITNVFIYTRKNKNAEYIQLDLSKFSSQVIFWLVIFLSLMLFYPGNNAFIYMQF